MKPQKFELKPFQNRMKELINLRSSWETDWRDISDYIRPTRGFFDAQPGVARSIDHKKILNNTPTKSARILSAGLMSGLTSPSRPWFRLGLHDDGLEKNEAVKLWLADVQRLMLGVFAKSNMYGILHGIYDEIGAFGTACAIILDDYEDVVRGRNFTVGEYVLGSGADGRINTFGRVEYSTVAQLVQQFGFNNVSHSVRQKYENGNIDEYVKFYHLIEPNDTRIAAHRDNRNMPYRSVYWEDSGDPNEFLKISGYESFPLVCPRWDLTTSKDVYGKGCGLEALGDSKMLQKMERNKLIALEKVVNPPLQKDASVVGDPNTLPGGVTYSNATTPNAGVRPAYEVRPDLAAIQASIQTTKQDIRETFYADLFLMITNLDRSDVTAREIVERHEEKLLMLGPVLERLESELLDPMIDRTFERMLAAGIVPPPPPELEGQDLKVEYISMLAQAQKMVGTAAVEQLTNFVGISAQVFPEMRDKINVDEVVNDMGEMLGVSPKIVRSDDEVAKIRAARAKQQAQIENAQKGMAMVEGAKTLSETKLEGNSALDKIVEAGTKAKAPNGI